MNLWRITVTPDRPEFDVHGQAVLHDLRDFDLQHVTGVASSRLFWVEGDIDAAGAKRIASELLADPTTDRFSIDEGMAAPDENGEVAIEIHLKPGVMDPTAASATQAIQDMSLQVQRVRTGRRYRIQGVASANELALIGTKILANDCIEDVYLRGMGTSDDIPSRWPETKPYSLDLKCVELLNIDDAALMTLSREGHLFLSLDEMRAIQNHFRSLEREPTDIELETIAQTWSEHCVHKTLKSGFSYRGLPFPGQVDRGDVRIEQNSDGSQITANYDNLLKNTIAQVTHRLDKAWCISVFEDNAGIIEFDEEFGIAFKVETHNHPSAIEPYGGAATGIGGCIRDIIGCGLAAKPVANTDVFCFADPAFPLDQLPKGVLHPRRVVKGVVGGVRDYGNRMGIPTVNGAVCFDNRYLGNPLVFCGSVGIIPKALSFKKTNPGDAILVGGGRTGRDGIHGATFSSAELTDTHADEFSHAVQIGNAITEKKCLDTILQARDHEDGCLYSAITDCGAGGLSSAVGEMGEQCGARVNLETIPLKYEGLRYDEIWISEAQERMVLSVPQKNLDRLLAIFAAEDVEAIVIGQFTDDQLLTLLYDGVQVGQLAMTFLHEGVPMPTKQAEWLGPAKPAAKKQNETTTTPDRLQAKLSHLDIAAKEWIIRQYDHEVQGGSVVKPLVGPGAGPSDGAVLRPRLDSDKGVALACGICPQRSEDDPYWMAVAAVDEAFRNVICVGGDPAHTAILDNFCWPKCEDPKTLGSLVRACQGAHDAAMVYGLPFISGKDSLNNEFAVAPEDLNRIPEQLRAALSPDGRIAIPATLLISSISVINDVTRCITADLKRAGNALWLVGGFDNEPELATLYAVHLGIARAIHEGLIASCHDVSDGGTLVSIAEMAIAGRLGVQLDEEPSIGWFGEPLAGYVVETSPDAIDQLKDSLGPDVPIVSLGRVTQEALLQSDAWQATIEQIDRDWRAPLAW